MEQLMKKKKVRLDIKRIEGEYRLYGLYNGDHLILESPRRKILEAMKRDEFKENVATNR